MRIFRIGIGSVFALMSFALATTPESPARAGDVPKDFKNIVSVETASLVPVALEGEPHVFAAARQDLLVWPLEEL